MVSACMSCKWVYIHLCIGHIGYIWDEVVKGTVGQALATTYQLYPEDTLTLISTYQYPEDTLGYL